jgi:ketopantoate hydroxymethyltransferase
MRAVLGDAVGQFAAEVESGQYPQIEHTYK